MSDPLALYLPSGCVVKGHLSWPQDVRDMVDDMLEIELPDGCTIDVGWVPEHEPNGQYRLVVFRDYWIEQVEAPRYTRDVVALIEMVEGVAWRHGEGSEPLP